MKRATARCSASVLAVCLAVVSGCATPAPPVRESQGGIAEELNRLLPAEALAGDFVLRHHVTVRWPEGEGFREEGFDAALQRRGESLLLLGFGAFSRVGFELELEGGRLRFANRTGREVPFRPGNIIADVQRVYYPWPAEPAQCSRCEREGRFGVVAVRERRSEGGIESRSFWVPGRPELGRVEIEYEGALLSGEIRERVHLRNGWFGYELVIENAGVDTIP